MLYRSRLSTDLLPLALRPDTYADGSDYNAYNRFDNDEYEIKQTKWWEKLLDRYRDEFNNDKFKKDIYKHWTDVVLEWINEKIVEYIPSFKAKPMVKGKLNSPQYYNYGTDRINFNYKIDVAQILSYIENNKEAIKEHLKKYQSYDGFSSFMPKHLAELYKHLDSDDNEEKDRAIVVVINYILTEIDDGEALSDIISDKYETIWEYFSMTSYCKPYTAKKIINILSNSN